MNVKAGQKAIIEILGKIWPEKRWRVENFNEDNVEIVL